MASEDMDAETEALIANLVAADMGEDIQSIGQQDDAWKGDGEDPLESYEQGSGLAWSPEKDNDTRIPVQDFASANGRYVNETKQAHSPATRGILHDYDASAVDNTVSASAVASFIQPQAVEEEVNSMVDGDETPSSLSKSKGKEKASIHSSDNQAEENGVSSAKGDGEGMANDDDDDDESSDARLNEHSTSNHQDHKRTHDEYEFDYLFEPCHRTWDAKLGISTLHVDIPWSFVARSLSIVPEETGRDRWSKKRHTELTGLEDLDAYGAVEVHEIVLSDAKDWDGLDESER